MDNSSDKTIVFDKYGYCNYCTNVLSLKDKKYFPNETGKAKIRSMIECIKKENAHNKYDCLMGISGGIDSSYLAYLGYKWGLRIIAVHIDDGFDTPISKENIEKLVKATGITLITIKPDSEQFYALTKAYMKAGVPNLAVPQDNILFGTLYKYAMDNNIKYFLSGENYALECILQRGNTHSPYDLVNIKHIHKKFGELPIDKLNFISHYKILKMKRLLNIKTLTPLNYIDYNRDRAFKELYEFCGFEYYGRKHLENILTAFIQLYWFPKKFGVDKRTSHLSSMIISEQLSREEALKLMQEPLYDEKLISEYIFVLKRKLNLSDDEFNLFMESKPKNHTDYKTDVLLKTYLYLLKILRNRKIK